MLDRLNGDTRVIGALAAAIAGTGEPHHLDRLIDLVAATLPHDVVTVTRYSTTERPVFLSYRHYSDAMVRQYLDVYYAYDPFYAHWRADQQPGVVSLRRFTDEAAKRGRYIAEFLRQSVIADEVGVLMADGEGACLGIFLDRADRTFTQAEIAAIEAAFPAFAALHALHVRLRGPTGGVRHPIGPQPAAALSEGPMRLPPGLWPELSIRERELAALVLAGHPSAAIARRLRIALGTVKNHRHRIYAKLDITSEREMFLQYFAFHAALSG